MEIFLLSIALLLVLMVMVLNIMSGASSDSGGTAGTAEEGQGTWDNETGDHPEQWNEGEMEESKEGR